MIDQLLKQTLSLLGILLSWFGVHSVIDHWINQTLCVSYFTEFIWGIFDNWLVNKEYNMC